MFTSANDLWLTRLDQYFGGSGLEGGAPGMTVVNTARKQLLSKGMGEEAVALSAVVCGGERRLAG